MTVLRCKGQSQHKPYMGKVPESEKKNPRADGLKETQKDSHKQFQRTKPLMWNSRFLY